MNIFYLSTNADECARYHCDKHVVKMILETAQMLSTAHRVLDGDKLADEKKLYKKVHVNHPSTKWVRESYANYSWAYDLLYSLCKEYTFRYNKYNKVQRSGLLTMLMVATLISVNPNVFPKDHYEKKRGCYLIPVETRPVFLDSHTAPPMCMPDQYKPSKELLDRKASEYVRKHSTVQAYKKYYLGEKLSFAKWTRREVPYWYSVGTDNPDLVQYATA